MVTYGGVVVKSDPSNEFVETTATGVRNVDSGVTVSVVLVVVWVCDRTVVTEVMVDDTLVDDDDDGCDCVCTGVDAFVVVEEVEVRVEVDPEVPGAGVEVGLVLVELEVLVVVRVDEDEEDEEEIVPEVEGPVGSPSPSVGIFVVDDDIGGDELVDGAVDWVEDTVDEGTGPSVTSVGPVLVGGGRIVEVVDIDSESVPVVV